MKIGLMFSNIRGSVSKALEFCDNIGLDGVQIGISYGRYNVEKSNERSYQKLEKLLIKNDLEISAYCGELGGHGFMIAKDNPGQVAKCKKMIDFAVDKGVKIISTHIGVIPEDKNCEVYKAMQSAMREVGIYAKERGRVLAIETGPEKAATLKDFIESLDGGIGVNLDPANFTMCARQDPVEAVYMLGDYIVHTHAKDGRNLEPVDTRFVYGFVNEEDKKGLTAPKGRVYEETPLGKGDVDWDKYLKALRDIGFDGYLTIEREYGSRGTKDDIKAGAQFLREKIYKKDKVNLAVVGCGSIANAAHFPNIVRNKNINVKYTCDLIEERAKKAKSKLKAEKAVLDYKEILKDKDVDAVLVCTHTDYHTIVAVDAMKAGKDVLSEKPVAMNYEDAQKMLEVSKETGRLLNIAVCMRYNTAVNRIKSYIEGGKLGNIYHVVCSFRGFRMIPGIGGDFTTKAKSGGGVLLDWGVHYLDLILYILGNPAIKTVTGDCYAMLGRDISKYNTGGFRWGDAPKNDGINDVEEYVTGHIRTDKDVTVSFNGAWAQNINEDEMYIDFLGDKGGIRYYYCKDFIYFGDDGKKLFKEKPKFDQCDMYRGELLDFVSAVRSGTNAASRNKIENLMPTALLLDSIYKSDAEKREISFE